MYDAFPQDDTFVGTGHAPVVQLDRISGFEPEGCRFESCRVRQPVTLRRSQVVKTLLLRHRVRLLTTLSLLTAMSLLTARHFRAHAYRDRPTCRSLPSKLVGDYERSNRPGVAPLWSLFESKISPFTTVFKIPSAVCFNRVAPDGRSWTTSGNRAPT